MTVRWRVAKMSFSTSNGQINILPQLVLSNTFDFLTGKDLLVAACVCKKWREIILTCVQFFFWDRLILHVKPPTGAYGKKHHEFHLLMCAKYAHFCKHLVIYVCQCQQENFNHLIGKLARVSLKSRLSSFIIRKANLNKCCQSKTEFKLCSESIAGELKTVIQHSKHLQCLSLGFDCDWTILETLSNVYSVGDFSLKVLNVATLSKQKINRKLNFLWLCQLHEVTINWELLSESLMQDWLVVKERFKLHDLKIIIDDTIINEHSDLHKAEDRVSDKESFTDLTFPLSQTWKTIKSSLPLLKVQLVIVAASSRLHKVLKEMPFEIPINQIVVIYRLSEFDESFPFQMWFARQNFSKLESLIVHGIEPPEVRIFHSMGDEWLASCSSSLDGLKNVTLSGMYVTFGYLMNLVRRLKSLESFHISKHDLLVSSTVHADLEINPTARQLLRLEKYISEKLGHEWKADRNVPLQCAYKHKCSSVLDIARCLLQKYEDDSRSSSCDRCNSSVTS